jgi:hypothetical protein
MQCNNQRLKSSPHPIHPGHPKLTRRRVARLWNVSEERGSEWQVDGVSSAIDFASSMFGTIEVKSFDFDRNLHCALAVREGHSENRRPSMLVPRVSGACHP